MYASHGLFIDGAWSGPATGASTEITDPGNGDVLGVVPVASVDDTNRAISVADKAFHAWKRMPAWTRADHLHKAADVMAARTAEAARQITLETGKPLVQAGREWALAVDQFRWYAEEARRIYGRIVESRVPGGRLEVTHEPVGVVAAFTAWNFPAALIARKVAPALAAGCAVIVRPSVEVPGVAMVLFDCLREAGLPAGVANLLIGPTGNTYKPIMTSPVVRKVSLTGSTRVGQQMIRDSAETVKRISMELGGNAPMIVFDDADLDKALDLAVPTKYANAGQVCVTPDRFYVHEALHDRFAEGFAARARALKLGHGLDEATQMGPLINERRIAAIEEIVADASDRGGKILTGGRRPADMNAGFFFEPTVITGLPDDAKAIAEENFGPIAAITPFSSTDEVFERANASEMGLSAYVFTRDAGRAREAAARLEAGMVGVNSFALAAAEAPFGGIKASGMGREGGTEGILDYSNVKLAQMLV
ncbi:NAD-dependent succinate-semialdehyde dehydrogenase [Shinella sp. CPCC 101442]|uniref:NAD-dependent succinate-semialdehyde dehydrogenase n=1 Tax=Shinella sp. CPCC 101442 TaxID=2932265 RepID=UPI0021534A60|nr:NAD-dependent succinate-semialdehyde dehydrogenase [Shinella sp. CPCC 101442]MCR6499055.1 NAD-dependent succinate-semialdehyde dehydrogenase [Shinella sp. CPCC 101442]